MSFFLILSHHYLKVQRGIELNPLDAFKVKDYHTKSNKSHGRKLKDKETLQKVYQTQKNGVS